MSPSVNTNNISSTGLVRLNKPHTLSSARFTARDLQALVTQEKTPGKDDVTRSDFDGCQGKKGKRAGDSDSHVIY
ncbi:hypothetical protein RRG08_036570 [Elysia crispata]|uniref:Uncharacterized protein n=1 Tax=Elysia crispata TaxID=231223 RepID=A0AAE1DL69_9GAST|nr:hypothetical protein RRG08_036570 [Elysia crispata]